MSANSLQNTVANATEDALSTHWDHVPRMVTLQAAKAAAGSDLGKASKMPCHSYGTSAAACKVGQKLAKVPGSVCATCYADPAGGGNYAYPGVQLSHANRMEALMTDPMWVEGMVTLIDKRAKYDAPTAKLTGGKQTRCFRWHDSGDLQTLRHLHDIVRIAKALPDVMFWLPSKEYDLVRFYMLIFGAFPDNLTVRMSAPMQGFALPKAVASLGLPVSYAAPAEHGIPQGVSECAAYATKTGVCGDCRVCWDATQTPCYPMH